MASAHSPPAVFVVTDMLLPAGPPEFSSRNAALSRSFYCGSYSPPACRLSVIWNTVLPREHRQEARRFAALASRPLLTTNQVLIQDHSLGTCILSPLLESWHLSWWGRCDTVEREWTFSQIGGLNPQITSFVTLGQLNSPHRC